MACGCCRRARGSWLWCPDRRTFVRDRRVLAIRHQGKAIKYQVPPDSGCIAIARARHGDTSELFCILVCTTCHAATNRHPLAAPFALADRLQKQMVTAFVPLGNILLARMSSSLKETSGANRAYVPKLRRELAIMAVSCGILVTLLSRPLMLLLSAQNIAPSIAICALMGCVVGLALFAILAPPLLLAPLGLEQAGARSAAASMVVGLTAVVVCGYSYGATGALTGVALGYLCAVTIQVWSLGRPGERASPGLAKSSPLAPNARINDATLLANVY